MAHNIPKAAQGLASLVPGVPGEEALPGGTLQGLTDSCRIGYGASCPLGGTHRYFFKLYASDMTVARKRGATK